MKPFTIICLLVGSLFSFTRCPAQNGNKLLKQNAVFQYATLSALMEGIYDGEITVGELEQKGNFGIGTFNALDGEMILADGTCYKVCSDGKVLEVSGSDKSPFATVCTFSPDTIIQIDHRMNLRELENHIDSAIAKPNLICAYQITGRFDTIVTRSVPKQEKPYKRLIEAYKQQGVFTYTHQEGILFGYKFPEYLKAVNLDNYHLHFLSTDRCKGGHLLSCVITTGKVSIAFIRNFSLKLPDNPCFDHSILTNKKSELLRIEGAGK
jgi:acetolactate decarboxylase